MAAQPPRPVPFFPPAPSSPSPSSARLHSFPSSPCLRCISAVFLVFWVQAEGVKPKAAKKPKAEGEKKKKAPAAKKPKAEKAAKKVGLADVVACLACGFWLMAGLWPAGRGGTMMHTSAHHVVRLLRTENTCPTSLPAARSSQGQEGYQAQGCQA